MPEVTVLMSVYYGLPFLAKAVESILGQTFKDFTFLIVDDGSTDGSGEYLEHLDDARIRIVRQPHAGLGAALQRGLAGCETEFLARMDADDVALPTRLEMQMNFLHRYGEIGLVGTQIVYLGSAGRTGFSPPLPCSHEQIYADLLLGRHAVAHSTVMCRTSVLRETGGYRTAGVGEDLDMLLRVGEASRLANLQQVLYLYRLHSGCVNVRQLSDIRTRYAYAIRCARCRAEGRTEVPFEEFIAQQRALPFRQRAADLLDIYALAQYRAALTDILNSNRAKGYARLGWAAVSSPRWTLQRIRRAIRRGPSEGRPSLVASPSGSALNPNSQIEGPWSVPTR